MTGEGGLIITNNKKIAVKCRLIRNHGEAIVNDDYSNEELVNVVGFNYRMTELHAAIAYVQTKKREKINIIRKNNYDYLVKRIISDFPEYLIPQKITHPDSYYAYTAAFKWNYKKTGVHRDIIAQALIAEGIPVFKGYHRLMCDHPMFKQKIAYGNNNYPWIDKNINYDEVDVPNARRLVDYEFLGFLQMGWPNQQKDMDDIIDAFAKIIENIDSVRKYDPQESKLSLGR